MQSQESPPQVLLEPLAVEPNSVQRDSNSNRDAYGCKDEQNGTNQIVVWRIAAAGIGLVLVILAVSLFWPGVHERTKFFTTSALSVLVLDIIAIQAYIYTKHWEAMRDSLEETRRMVKQNERLVKIAQRNMFYGLRAYVTIPKGSIHFGNDEAWFVFVIENAGKTPAKQIRIRTVVESAKNSASEHPVFAETDQDWSAFAGMPRTSSYLHHGENTNYLRD